MGRKWSNIKLKKAALDQARCQNYTKVLREVTIAVKRAGPDPESNFSLKLALLKARQNNVPKDNVEKAIKKGQNEGGANYEEITYEGYGVDGVAIFVEAATDNPTRTVANVRSYFNKVGGALGKEGCLQFVFERKAIFTLEKNDIDPDELTLELIDHGAEDIEEEDGYLTIKAPVEAYGPLHQKLEEMNLTVAESGLERLPLNMKEVATKESFDKIMKLVDLLDADDDVQKVYHNLEYNEEFADG